MKSFDTEHGEANERKPRHRAHRREAYSKQEVDYVAAVARAIEADSTSEVDYEAAVARAIEADFAPETDYISAVARAIEEDDEDYDYEEEQLPESRPRHRFRRAIATIFIMLLIVLGGSFVFITFFLQPPVDRGAFTILIAGQDNVGTHGLTDTLMLLNVDSESGAVNIVSIPRDTRADVSWSTPKINSVFAMTGGNIYRLMEEVEKLVGFMPDFYVVLNLQAFIDLVDALGGVYLDVPIRMQYSDTHARPPLHIDLEPGYQRLTGEQAMHFVRFRTGTGDLGRIQRQQYLLRALAIESMHVRNVARIPAFMEIFGEHVDTNLPISGMAYLASHMIWMDEESINTHSMPTEPFRSDLAPVLNPWLEIINNYLNPYPETVTLENLRLYTRINGNIQLAGSGLSLSAGR